MMKTDRIQAFSDGIFSILITILVLEFKIPDGYVQGNLLQAVLQQWPTLVAYVMTFTYIGILWLFHHDMFSCVQRIDAGLNILNLSSIFLTTLLNYSMSLLAESLVTLNTRDLQFALTLYALLALGISMSYFAFYYYLAHKPSLLASSKYQLQFRRLQRCPLLSSSIYFAALLAANLKVYAGLIFLVAGILFHGFAYWRAVRHTATV